MPKSLESADGGGQLAEATHGQAGPAARQEGLEAVATPHLVQVRGLPGPGGPLTLSLTWPPPVAHICRQEWLQWVRKLVCPGWGSGGAQGTELRLSPVFVAAWLCGCG